VALVLTGLILFVAGAVVGQAAFPNLNSGASNGMHNLHHNHPGSLSSQSSRDSSPARFNHDAMANHSGTRLMAPTSMPQRPPQDPLRGQTEAPVSVPAHYQQQSRPAPFGLTRPMGPAVSWQNFPPTSSAAPTAGRHSPRDSRTVTSGSLLCVVPSE